MCKKLFQDPEGCSFYEIRIEGEYINILWYINPYIFRSEKEISEDSFSSYTMHIGNIPQALEAMEFAFRAPMGRGEIKSFIGFDEKVYCMSNTERSFNHLTFGRERDYENIMNDDQEYLEFNIEPYHLCTNPKERKYTPEMLWLSKQLMDIYKKWEKEQNK